MHTLLNTGNLNRPLRLLSIGLLLVLTSCASDGGYRSPIESRPVAEDATSSETESVYGWDDSEERSTPFEDRNFEIQQAQRYQQLAEDDNGTDKADAALSSAELYIQADDPERALLAVRELDSASMTPVQLYRHQIVLAYIEYSRQSYHAALARLQRVLDSLVDSDPQFRRQQVDALLLGAFCYQQVGQSAQAIRLLIEREALLTGTARVETSRYIAQVIGQLPAATRQNIIESTTDPRVRSRVEQSLQGEIGNATVAPRQFDRWRDARSRPQVQMLQHDWGQDSPRNIMVLLPSSSRFGKAAQAVMDGIQFQHSLNQSPWLPNVEFYDIGADPLQISLYYQAAQQRGADLIIGPLGKDFADSLMTSSQVSLSTPTILLGGSSALRNRSTRLSLSPEQESADVARRALESGHINAALLVPTSASGTRAADAFSRAWLASGGKLSKVISYSPAQFDHSTELRQMFDLNQSEQRHRELADVLGFRPEFAPYRRADIDFIYMIADDKTGRIVRPQINFFSGNKVPVFAPSSIYNGIQDQANNLDLEGTLFPSMPWVLAADQISPYAGQLNRLFAMGADAYRLAGSLHQLQARPGWSIQGNTGSLSISQSGETISQPVWAVFKEGLAEASEALPELELPGRPSANPGKPGSGRSEGTQYNEQNWDSREARRKPGR